jgi:hypothetical protein
MRDPVLPRPAEKQSVVHRKNFLGQNLDQHINFVEHFLSKSRRAEIMPLNTVTQGTVTVSLQKQEQDTAGDVRLGLQLKRLTSQTHQIRNLCRIAVGLCGSILYDTHVYIQWLRVAGTIKSQAKRQ